MSAAGPWAAQAGLLDEVMTIPDEFKTPKMREL
jgi:hypothetical protein